MKKETVIIISAISGGMVKKKSNKMYEDRQGNKGIIEGCKYNCIYCETSFKAILKRFGTSEEDEAFIPHVHMERLNSKPPRTQGNEFVTIGLTGDISFALDEVVRKIIEYCKKWRNTTFLIQSKNPEFFLKFDFPENVLLATTIETNYEIFPTTCAYGWARYEHISKAPLPIQRALAMSELGARKENRFIVTIEPILDCDIETMVRWMRLINPVAVYIGYCSSPEKWLREHRFPEPTLDKTRELIHRLQEVGIEVRLKLLRKAWYEDGVRDGSGGEIRDNCRRE
jgi:hypothetical protein